MKFNKKVTGTSNVPTPIFLAGMPWRKLAETLVHNMLIAKDLGLVPRFASQPRPATLAIIPLSL